MSVEINLGYLAHGFEFDKDLATLPGVGRRESFSIPSPTAPLGLLTAMTGQGPIIKGIGIVVGVRRGDGGPGGIIKTGSGRTRGICLDKFPIGIEIEVQPLRAPTGKAA